MEQIRAFIAVELPDEIRAAIGKLEEELKSAGNIPVKWVNPGGMHLTLVFLGNIIDSQIGDITAAMELAAQGIPPFTLEAGTPGAFPNLKRVRVVWVGLKGGTDTLCRLQRRIESNLEPLGFVPEVREFTPHLTLARVRNEASAAERNRLGELIFSTEFEAGIIKVSSVSLMRSQLSRTGAVYSRIRSIELK